MLEREEKISIFNEGNLSGSYPEIEFVVEYLNQDKPEFHWNPRDNIVACLQFSKCQPFPELYFQKFIVEWQGRAYVKIHEIEMEGDAIENNKEGHDNGVYNSNNDDDDNQNYNENYKETDEDTKSNESNEDIPLPEYLRNSSRISSKEKEVKRFIWANGMYFEQHEDESQYQLVIEKNEPDKHILVKCSGKSDDARQAFDNVINWFKNLNIPLNIRAICTCDLCKKKTLESAHQIDYEDLKSLKNQFEPKVQCYKSGIMKMLDDISTIDRPSFKSVIINAPEDDEFCREVRKHLSPQNSPIISSPFDRLSIPGTSIPHLEFERKITYADIVILLISSDLIGGEDEKHVFAREMSELAIAQFIENQKPIVVAILLREYNSWNESYPFNSEKIQTLNQEPVSNVKNDKAWSKISEQYSKLIKRLKTIN